jgi:hypothetical protein
MAGKDLDALAKGLAEERISRGGALKRMGAILLGGLLAASPAAAFATQEPERGRCKGNQLKCAHDCCPNDTEWRCFHGKCRKR